MKSADLEEAIRFVRVACAALGWSQRELSRRSGVPQTAISRLLRGRLDAIDLAQLVAIAVAFGARAALTFDAPFLADRARQRDRVHATCVAYVARRLRAAGSIVATEVEIDGRFGPGWIDIMAFHPPSGRLLVIEIKTEIADLGRIQRTLGWYVHASAAAARRLGWHPRSTAAALVVMATRTTDDRLRANRDLVRIAFPTPTRALRRLIDDPLAAGPIGWSIAVIDPLSRAHLWLRSTVLDDPRLAARHPDDAAVASALEARSRRAAESHRLGSKGSTHGRTRRERRSPGGLTRARSDDRVPQTRRREGAPLPGRERRAGPSCFASAFRFAHRQRNSNQTWHIGAISALTIVRALCHHCGPPVPPPGTPVALDGSTRPPE